MYLAFFFFSVILETEHSEGSLEYTAVSIALVRTPALSQGKVTGACFILSFSTLPYSLKILLQKLMNLLDGTGLVLISVQLFVTGTVWWDEEVVCFLFYAWAKAQRREVQIVLHAWLEMTGTPALLEYFMYYSHIPIRCAAVLLLQFHFETFFVSLDLRTP